MTEEKIQPPLDDFSEELRRRFTYHLPKEGQPEKYTALREEALMLALKIEKLCPHSRERSLAFTKLEECIMHANASIARRS
jgi:hypothetical protein